MSSRGVIVKPDFGGARYLVPLYELTIKSFSSHELSTLSTSSLPMLSCQRGNLAVPVASDIVMSCFSSPALTSTFSDIRRTLGHVCSSGYLVTDVE